MYAYITYIHAYTFVSMHAYVCMYIDVHGHILYVCMYVHSYNILAYICMYLI